MKADELELNILNGCTTGDAQISWGVRPDSTRFHRPLPYPSWEPYQMVFWSLASYLLSHKLKGWLLLLTPGKLPLSFTPCPIMAPSPPLQSQLPLCLEIRKLLWLTDNHSHSCTEPWCCAAAKMCKLPAVFTWQLSTQRQGDGDQTWCSREASWN